MKTELILAVSILIWLAACTGNRNEKATQQIDTSAQSTEVSALRLDDTVLCYQRTQGETRLDSTYVYLKLNGDSVQGVYHWLPAEKDARRGVIYGKRRGDTIEVIWNFTQEGVDDTLRTAFLMTPKGLKQKPFGVDETTGRQIMNAEADFSIEYKPAPCPALIADIQ